MPCHKKLPGKPFGLGRIVTHGCSSHLFTWESACYLQFSLSSKFAAVDQKFKACIVMTNNNNELTTIAMIFSFNKITAGIPRSGG